MVELIAAAPGGRRSPMRVFALALAASLLVLAPACGAAPPSVVPAALAAGLPDGDPALARKLVAAGAPLIDVRTPAEFAERHVEGAVNIPVEEISSRMPEVEKLAGGDKNKPIVVYCQSGRRAARAKQALMEAGFLQVTNLGGLSDWDRK